MNPVQAKQLTGSEFGDHIRDQGTTTKKLGLLQNDAGVIERITGRRASGNTAKKRCAFQIAFQDRILHLHR